MTQSQTGPNNNLLVVISAPSGTGKTTLCKHLLEANPRMTRAITCTTRSPRDGEKDGIDYYFLDADSFLRRVQAEEFLEHATVHGHSYGTLKSEVFEKLESGKDVLLNVDVQGEAVICEQAANDEELKHALVTIFFAPPSLAELERRLRSRGLDSREIIESRLSIARHEISQWKNFDYLLISDSMEEDLRRSRVILEAERLRKKRSRLPNYE